VSKSTKNRIHRITYSTQAEVQKLNLQVQRNIQVGGERSLGIADANHLCLSNDSATAIKSILKKLTLKRSKNVNLL
jgi:hypothetical protein